LVLAMEESLCGVIGVADQIRPEATATPFPPWRPRFFASSWLAHPAGARAGQELA
jgi:hypothetical protein